MADRVLAATVHRDVTVLYAATVRPFDTDGLAGVAEFAVEDGAVTDAQRAEARQVLAAHRTRSSPGCFGAAR